MAKQVVIASSVTQRDVNDALLSPQTKPPIFPTPFNRLTGKEDIPAKISLSQWKVTTRKLVETANLITGKAHSAFVTTRKKKDWRIA